MPLTSYSLDRFLAPKLSGLTGCDAPVLTYEPDEVKRWLSAFVLNSVLRVQLQDPYRQLAFSFLRRVDAAVLNYSEGRERLFSFVASQQREGIGGYSRSLYSFETAVATTYQALLLFRQMFPEKPALFARGDGSVFMRMDRIYNAGKHADEFIANGGRFAADSTLPVWFVNEGLESVDCVLRFDELAQQIESVCRVGKQLTALRASAS